jgi:hypothetical protein
MGVSEKSAAEGRNFLKRSPGSREKNVPREKLLEVHNLSTFSQVSRNQETPIQFIAFFDLLDLGAKESLLPQ